MNIKKALVVDDSKVAHITLRRLLTERGIEVDWVGSGEDCIKYLDTKKPQIIFMDVMMPGMDGFETSRTITGRQPDTAPIIMCSANATDEDKRDARDSGAVGFLSKPYTPEQLDEVLNKVSAGIATISMEPVATPAPLIPRPVIVEKAPPPARSGEPSISIPIIKTPAAPVPATPIAETAPATPGLSVADIEQIAERAAWAAAEKVARDLVQELVPNLAREAATQAARSISEDLGRRAAHAAVRAAQEAAKQIATEIARGTAERTARTAAQESARAVAEVAAREVSESVSQRNIARGLEMNRDELFREIEVQVKRQTQEAMVMATSAPEFKQQVIQMVRGGIQPVIETIAREAADRSVHQAAANLATHGGAPGQSRATAALVIGLLALLAAGAAIVGSILKLF
ncbi:MAG: response regulator [Candidatus Contendobacter sp.]|nr:response regulator [Candidatus Contendobacter sp.]